MKMMKASVIFALGILLGFGSAVIGYRLHKRIDFATKAQHLKNHAVVALDRVFGAKARAARLEHVVAPVPYFPPGSIWTQDISHAPLDPQSSTIITWLENAGGWGRGDRMQVDFAIRVLQTDAGTPYVPFTGPGPDYADSDQITVFPLPAGGGIEGEAGYHCPNIDRSEERRVGKECRSRWS